MLGDFDINFMQNSSEKKTLSKYLTDYKTQIDHIYTNSPKIIYCSGVLRIILQ